MFPLVLGRLDCIGGLPVDVTFSLRMVSLQVIPLSFLTLTKKMPPKRKAYGTDPRAAKAAKFHVDCERSGMPISIPSAMRAKGYDNDAAKDDSLQQQVRRLAADLKQK